MLSSAGVTLLLTSLPLWLQDENKQLPSSVPKKPSKPRLSTGKDRSVDSAVDKQRQEARKRLMEAKRAASVRQNSATESADSIEIYVPEAQTRLWGRASASHQGKINMTHFRHSLTQTHTSEMNTQKHTTDAQRLILLSSTADSGRHGDHKAPLNSSVMQIVSLLPWDRNNLHRCLILLLLLLL